VAATIPETRIDTAEIDADMFVVCVSGMLDDVQAPELSGALLPIAGADGSFLLLDLQSANFVGAAALGVIASAAHVSRRRGETMVIVTRNPVFIKSVRDSGLADIVRLERTIGDGIANVR
jgi:anti-anti-sigma factor